MRLVTNALALAIGAALAGCVVQPGSYAWPDEGAAPDSYAGGSYAGDSSQDYQEPPDSPDQITEPPPPLPVYAQPPCPEPGYLWTPGVWQWGPAGYFWVPGTWIAPPAPGLLWTPGYWGLAGGAYVFHTGYWGPHVGFYGGIDYGFGYGGDGYGGGRWEGGAFAYNTAVSNVNVNIVHNTYNETIVNNVNVVGGAPANRVSYAGGPGTRLRPNAAEISAAGDAHLPPTGTQVQHQMIARGSPDLAARRNEGRPSIAATTRAREFSGGVVAAEPVGPAYRPAVAPVARSARYNPYVHASDAPMPQVNSVWGGGANAGAQAYAARRNDLFARQEQQRQDLARQQQLEHERFVQQPAHDHAAFENLERQHWQQTSRLLQQHQQEYRQFVRAEPVRSAPPPRR